jgi:hypothetical protein
MVGLLILVGGCTRVGPDDVAQRAELHAVAEESAALDSSLDEVGDRLLTTRAALSTLSVLRERHEKVSQVACQNLSGHWEGISRFIENQDEKASRKRRQSLAQIDTDVR